MQAAPRFATNKIHEQKFKMGIVNSDMVHGTQLNTFDFFYQTRVDAIKMKTVQTEGRTTILLTD